MIQTKEYHIEKWIDQAIEKVNKTNDVHLVSVTKKIEPIDVLRLFEGAKQTGLDRTYWSSTDDDFTIVGIGNAHEIDAQGNHFEKTKQAWLALMERSYIHNPYDVAGTGVLALGGMTFDPKKEQTSLWKNYGQSLFVVPTYTVVEHEDTYYFTYTHAVDKDSLKNDVSQRFSNAEEQMNEWAQNVDDPVRVEIVNKEEIGTEKWLEDVKQAITYINENKANKIVLAREMRIQLNRQAAVGQMLRKLHQLQTNCFIYAFERGDDCFIGATPERLVRIDGDKLLSTCLAGTAPRGRTERTDEEIRTGLLHDAKNLEEHAYVVQMITDAITPYCTDIKTANEPVVRPLKNVQHLYTPVTATVKEGYHLFDFVEQLHPTPALGGVPNDIALAFIREHELLDRGWYGAPIGWLDSNQHGEFAVGIRSALVQKDAVSLFAGCGIMKDSDPLEEFEETSIKFLPILSVLEDDHESY